MARCLDLLAQDLDLVTELSANAKVRASTWKWPELVADWARCYSTLIDPAVPAEDIEALEFASPD
jgi:hypothetical protein